MRRQDERRRGSLAPSSSSAIEALTAPVGHGGDGGRVGDASLLEGVGKEVRSGHADGCLCFGRRMNALYMTTLFRVFCLSGAPQGRLSFDSSFVAHQTLPCSFCQFLLIHAHRLVLTVDTFLLLRSIVVPVG